jgi:hypothetical protein
MMEAFRFDIELVWAKQSEVLRQLYTMILETDPVKSARMVEDSGSENVERSIGEGDDVAGKLRKNRKKAKGWVRPLLILNIKYFGEATDDLISRLSVVSLCVLSMLTVVVVSTIFRFEFTKNILPLNPSPDHQKGHQESARTEKNTFTRVYQEELAACSATQ